mmetsp:Transcript_4502/g.13345  ORF Transcript_4502/g.13345 Transcript_4502/m.13345 type:complete len:390 (+) Transcript_4502:497-1666(+)
MADGRDARPREIRLPIRRKVPAGEVSPQLLHEQGQAVGGRPGPDQAGGAHANPGGRSEQLAGQAVRVRRGLRRQPAGSGRRGAEPGTGVHADRDPGTGARALGHRGGVARWPSAGLSRESRPPSRRRPAVRERPLGGHREAEEAGSPPVLPRPDPALPAEGHALRARVRGRQRQHRPGPRRGGAGALADSAASAGRLRRASPRGLAARPLLRAERAAVGGLQPDGLQRPRRRPALPPGGVRGRLRRAPARSGGGAGDGAAGAELRRGPGAAGPARGQRGRPGLCGGRRGQDARREAGPFGPPLRAAGHVSTGGRSAGGALPETSDRHEGLPPERPERCRGPGAGPAEVPHARAVAPDRGCLGQQGRLRGLGAVELRVGAAADLPVSLGP